MNKTLKIHLWTIITIIGIIAFTFGLSYTHTHYPHTSEYVATIVLCIFGSLGFYGMVYFMVNDCFSYKIDRNKDVDCDYSSL